MYHEQMDLSMIESSFKIPKEYVPTSKWQSSLYETPKEGNIVWLIEDSNKREIYNYEAKIQKNKGVFKRAVVKFGLVIQIRKDVFGLKNWATDAKVEHNYFSQTFFFKRANIEKRATQNWFAI